MSIGEGSIKRAAKTAAKTEESKAVEKPAAKAPAKKASVGNAAQALPAGKKSPSGKQGKSLPKPQEKSIGVGEELPVYLM